MTARERVNAVLAGRPADQRPAFGWPIPDEGAEVLVDRLAPDQVALKAVRNPFGRAMAQGLDLNEELRRDPHRGGERLDDLQAQCAAEMENALTDGYSGVLYLLHGARFQLCSPMQYGGLYLERDRELLSDLRGRGMVTVFVVGDEDVFLDFVSDLPADIFAWDSVATEVTSDQLRQMRRGTQASQDPASEFLLPTIAGGISRLLEKITVAAH